MRKYIKVIIRVIGKIKNWGWRNSFLKVGLRMRKENRNDELGKKRKRVRVFRWLFGIGVIFLYIVSGEEVVGGKESWLYVKD